MHESFLSQNIFRDSKKIFCDFSAWVEPKRTITFANNWPPFQFAKINKHEDHFFSVLYAMEKSFIDQASSVKMAGYWPRSLFAFLWTSTSSRSIKTQKLKRTWPISSHLDLVLGQQYTGLLVPNMVAIFYLVYSVQL